MSVQHVKTDGIGDFTGTVTVFNSQASTTTVAATNLVRPSDWNSGHNVVQNFGGNTAGTSQISGTDLFWAGGNNITLSANGSTVSVNGPAPGTVSRYYADFGMSTVTAQPNASVVSIVNMPLGDYIAASAIGFPASISAASAANTSSAGHVYSLSVVIYTRNGSTLSSINSGSQTFSAFYQSNSTASFAGLRDLSVSLASTSLFAPGNYYAAVHVSSATTSTGAVASWTSLGATHSMGCVPQLSQLNAIAAFGAATNATNYIRDGVGYVSTGATLATIPFTSITGTGVSAAAANLWFDLRNYTM